MSLGPAFKIVHTIVCLKAFDTFLPLASARYKSLGQNDDLYTYPLINRNASISLPGRTRIKRDTCFPDSTEVFPVKVSRLVPPLWICFLNALWRKLRLRTSARRRPRPPPCGWSRSEKLQGTKLSLI